MNRKTMLAQIRGVADRQVDPATVTCATCLHRLAAPSADCPRHEVDNAQLEEAVAQAHQYDVNRAKSSGLPLDCPCHS